MQDDGSEVFDPPEAALERVEHDLLELRDKYGDIAQQLEKRVRELKEERDDSDRLYKQIEDLEGRLSAPCGLVIHVELLLRQLHLALGLERLDDTLEAHELYRLIESVEDAIGELRSVYDHV